jgi:Trypsin-co-occurring domain 2
MAEMRIPLAEVIQSLRSELMDAMRVGSVEELKFGVGPVDMEFQLDVTKEVEAGTGVKFWVINADAKGSYTSASTQRVKLTLTPVTVSGGEVKVTSFVTGDIG